MWKETRIDYMLLLSWLGLGFHRREWLGYVNNIIAGGDFPISPFLPKFQFCLSQNGENKTQPAQTCWEGQ